MRVLALDTATPATAVGLLPDGLEDRHEPPAGERPGHAGLLLALAHGLLERAGIGFAEVDRVAVGTGPGTFTGLRIGVATARALAQAAGAELVGVSTLLTLAEGAREQAGGPVLAVLDARRGEAFAGVWDDGRELVAPAAVAPDALAGPAGRAALAVGDGAVRFRAVLEQAGIAVPDDASPLHRVSALVLGRLAASRPAGDPASVLPEYLRIPDAELALRRR